MSLIRNSKLVTKKFFYYLIPSILMAVAMQTGSFVDGILIGNMIGDVALTGTSLVTPILYIIQAPGYAFGIGGSIVAANLLGKRDIKKAKTVFSFCMIVGIAISIVFSVVGIFVARPLAGLFGEANLDYSYPFLFMYLVTDPMITFALIIGSFISIDNHPKLGSAYYIISNVAKIGIEILLINVLKSSGNSVYGAAASTAAGYAVGLVVLIPYIRSDKRMLSINFHIKGAGLKEIIKASSTSGINLILTCIQMFIVNVFIGSLITDPVDLVAYGLIANMVFIFDLMCGGIVNVIPVVCGIFYGEKDLYSLKAVTRKIYLINLCVTTALTIFLLALPNVYCYMFGSSDEANMGYICNLLRIYLISFIPYEISKFSMNYYPSVDKTPASLVTVFLRELVIVVPVTIGLLYSNGIMGYSIACAVTEWSTVLITYAFIFFYYNKKKQTHGIFMFDKKDVDSFDVTIVNEVKESVELSTELIAFAKEKNVPNRECQMIGLAAEEMVNNIITYGYKKNHLGYIDVSLKLVGESMFLSIRDDGFPFDPTKYDFDNDTDYETMGIALIKGVTDNMSYTRSLNLNNTVVEINLAPTAA